MEMASANFSSASNPSQSKLIRSRSITGGRFRICVWMDPMYSPRIPMKES